MSEEWSEDELWEDARQEEDSGDSQSKKSSKPPKPYDHLTWEQYKRCKLRETMMAQLQCIPRQYMVYVREHQEELRTQLPDDAKESMRRVIQYSIEMSREVLSDSDLDIINRVFGPYKKAIPPAHLMFEPSREDPFYGNCTSRIPTDVILWFRGSTFNAFHRFMHKEPEISEFIKGLTEEEVEMLREALDYQCMRDAGPMSPRFRHYQEGDREDMEGIIDRNRGVA